MSSPTNATAAWERLMRGPHTPHEWRRILDAADQADEAIGRRERAAPPWCAEALRHLGTPEDLYPARMAYGSRVEVDRDLVRRWLVAPLAYADEPISVAEEIELFDLRHALPAEAHSSARGLLQAARAAGLFGLAQHSIEVHQAINDDGWGVGQLLVVRSPTGIGIASPILPPAIVQDPTGRRIGDAVAVLAAAAEQVNATLDAFDTVVRNAVRPSAFPSLSGQGRIADLAAPPAPPERPGRSR
jgi:hypothetical protein